MTFPLVPDLDRHIEQARHDRGHHFHPHGYVRTPEDSRGRCTWRWDSDGCAIVCWNYDLPPTRLCVHHASLAAFPLQIAGDAG